MKPKSMSVITVFLADDHAVVRRGLKALIGTEPDMEIVGEAENGRQAIELSGRLKPDVVLMDLVMPEVSGVEATRQIVAHHRPTRVLVLTSFGSDDKLFPAIKAGAQGYLLKDASPEELVRAIRATAKGLSSLNQTVARRLLAELAGDGGSRPGRGRWAERLAPRPHPGRPGTTGASSGHCVDGADQAR